MTAAEINKRIAEAVQAVRRMDSRTHELAVQAGLLNPRVVPVERGA